MIGHIPLVEDMAVVAGQPFIHRFEADDAFPPDTDVVLKVYDRTGDEQVGSWPAVQVDSNGVLVTINPDELIPIEGASVYRVWVSYDTLAPMCWYQGRVRRLP